MDLYLMITDLKQITKCQDASDVNDEATCWSKIAGWKALGLVELGP